MSFINIKDELSKALKDYDFSKTTKISDSIIDNSKPEKFTGSNITSDNLITVSQEELTNKQIDKQNEILEFLKLVTIEQSKTSKRQSNNTDKQFKTTVALMIITIIIGVFSLKPVFFNQSNTEYKTLYEHTIELEKTILKQDLTISQLSNNLLDLQSQVQTLEKQNVELSKNKID